MPMLLEAVRNMEKTSKFQNNHVISEDPISLVHSGKFEVSIMALFKRRSIYFCVDLNQRYVRFIRFFCYVRNFLSSRFKT